VRGSPFAPPEPAAGDRVGGYVLESILGKGGMGTVYRARQVSLGRSVALKLMLPKYAAAKGARERFEREAKVSAQLRHPSIVEVYDFGEAAGFLFLAMELLEGTTLRAVVDVDRPPLPWPRAVEITLRITDALKIAHARGVVHRDLKPENVFLERQSDGTERVVLVDFGLAFIEGDEALGRMTQEGMITGTPDYASPEQALGQPVGPPTDVYALGCMLFEMLAARTPFAGHPMRVLTQQMYSPPPQLADVRHDVVVPKALAELVMHMLAKKSGERPTVDEVHDALLGLGEGGALHERARERIGLEGRAARMISTIRPPGNEKATLDAGDEGHCELAVIGMLEGDLAVGLAANGIQAFIVSDDQPVKGADAIFAPGASVEVLSALGKTHGLPVVADASPRDPARVPALLRAGVDEVVSAPVQTEDLARRVWRAVRKRRARLARSPKP
jgi:serine/threonine-protein kinase